MDLIERRYARMIDQSACEPVLTAYIICHGRTTGILIGDEFVRAFDDAEVSGAAKLSPAAIEGAAMLAINARIFRLRPELVVFHAGAVALGDRAAVIVGPTTSGKSTTCLSLLLRSSEYRALSDEFALVNTTTERVEAFPRLFSVRAGARRLLGIGSLALDWETVEPAGALGSDWSASAARTSFFFIIGKAKNPHIRALPLSEAIFMAVGSEVQTTIDINHLRIVDRVIKGLSNSRLYAITLGSPGDTADTIARLTLESETAVA